MSDAGWIIVGRVRRAHGVRGELVIETLTDAPEAIFASGARVFMGTTHGDPGTRLGRRSDAPDELHIASSKPFKGGLIVAFDGLSDRNVADTWRERFLLVPEDEVEPPDEDEIFLDDLLGMQASNPDGSSLGTVKEFYELPQGIVLEIALPEGSRQREVLVPFTDEVVTAIDREARTIVVAVPDGLLD